jgi:hypothetical protein
MYDRITVQMTRGVFTLPRPVTLCIIQMPIHPQTVSKAGMARYVLRLFTSLLVIPDRCVETDPNLGGIGAGLRGTITVS